MLAAASTSILYNGLVVYALALSQAHANDQLLIFVIDISVRRLNNDYRFMYEAGDILGQRLTEMLH